jgi:isopentenyl-diphosphate Delta-isomerase
MIAEEELFATFDTAGAPTGTAPRSLVHRQGLWHQAANVLLFRSDGRLIVQQRSGDKDVCPGAWDLSVAEHLKPGETYEQGALRGLREELGVANVALQRLGDAVQARLEIADKGIKDYELQQSFRGIFDGDVRPDPIEVRAVDLMTLAEVTSAMRTRPDDFTPWFRDAFDRLGLSAAS